MGTSVFLCSLGPTGIGVAKREGDGKTPAGTYGLQHLLVRRDRMPRLACRLAQRAIAGSDGWSDDSGSPQYNRPVRLPYSGRHELMWRSDHLYDIVVVIAYNRGPVLKKRGSAIFMHVEATPRKATAGCIALQAGALKRVLRRVGARTRIIIA